MAPRKKDSYEMRGKYSKLDGQEDDEAETIRPSLEEFYRDKSSSDEEDIDEFDPLHHDAGTLKKKERTPLKTNGELLPIQKKSWFKRWLIPSRFCCSLILLFSLTVLSLLSVGGIWVLNS